MINSFIFFIKNSVKYAIILVFFTQATPHAYTPAQMLQLCQIQPPPPTKEVAGMRSATLNSRGYVFSSINPVAQRFIAKEATPDKALMEIGSGFGPVAYAALRHGAGSYIANDMSLDHLKLLVQGIVNQAGNEADFLLKRLLLLHAQAPKELPKIYNYFDAILLDKVFHFMNPEEIEQLFDWLNIALKPHGRVYILTISPYAATFKDELLPIYHLRKETGDLYPGYVENIFDYFKSDKLPDYPDYQLSYALTFFCKTELEELFVSRGFSIRESYCVTLPNTKDGSWQIVDETESGLVALIAQKES